MKYIFFSTLLIFFLSCNNQDSAPTQKNLLNDSLKNSLLGKWGGLGENEPVWEIKKDSIYYYEEGKSYYYFILRGDFIIKRLNSSVALKNIHVYKDTLFFLDDQGLTIKGYRFK